LTAIDAAAQTLLSLIGEF